jgi:predicted outer membrane protein
MSEEGDAARRSRWRQPGPPKKQENIMQKNQVVKKLLALTAVAAMFSAVGVQAQTSGQSAQSMTNQSATGKQNMTGKTATDGTVNNTSSQGMEDRSGQMGTTRAEGAKSHTAGTMHSTSGASGAAGATGSGAAKLSAADKKAITDMAIANMAEVETGKLALSKSQNAEVKTFAQQMIDDHGKALSEVQTLAQSKGVTLPTELDAKHTAMAAKLEKLSGDAFDKAYMKQAGLNDHKATHTKLQKISKSAKDADVKAAADRTIPTVEQHLKAAEQMSKAKSGTTSGK